MVQAYINHSPLQMETTQQNNSLSAQELTLMLQAHTDHSPLQMETN